MRQIFELFTLLIILSSCFSKAPTNDVVYENEWLTFYNSTKQHIYENSAEKTNFSYYNAFRVNCIDNNRKCQIFAKYEGNFNFNSNYNLYIPQILNISLILNSKQEFRIKITDYDQKLFEYPEGYNEDLNIDYPFPYDKVDYKEADVSNALYKVMIYSHPFSFKVYRVSTGECLFDTSLGQLFLSDKYITLTSQVTSDNIFGLGERFDSFKVKNGSYQIYNTNNPTAYGVVDKATYGSHPVYLMREKSKKYHAVFLRNIADMLVSVNTDNELKSIKYEVINSIFDFKFFLGDTPEEVTQLYHEYIGGFTVFPFWAYGYQHCRWGYNNIQEVQQVFQNYSDYNIPIDVFWLDIDYFDDYQIFVTNKDTFPQKEIYKLKYETMGYELRGMAIIDPTVSSKPLSTQYDKTNDTLVFYKPFWEGLADGIFLESQIYNNWSFLGKQWAGPVYYPDFVNPGSKDYWQKCLQDFLDENLSYNNKKLLNGLWLDMNEIDHFVTANYNISAELDGQQYTLDESPQCLKEKQEYPFLPADVCPSKRTIASNLIHYDGASEIQYHSSFGLFECQQSNKAMRKPFDTDLPFIVTRSQTAGSGKYATHWLGDDFASFPQMKISIGGIQRSNFYGMPLAGSDICGYGGNSFGQLCARWAQIGALYPFSRNHNAKHCKVHGVDQHCPPNDPWRPDWNITETFRVNMQLKYTFVSYYYSLFLYNNIENMKDRYFKGTICRAPFFNYPDDEELYTQENIDSTFMIGKELIAFPIVVENTTERQIYFPKGSDFFDFHTGKKVMPIYATQRTMNITNLITDLVPVYQVGGTIVPRQNIQKDKGFNTELFETDNYEAYQLQIALNQDKNQQQSKGILLPIRNLINDKIIYKYCVNQNNCVQTLDLVANNDKIELSISSISDATMKLMKAQDTDAKTFFHNLESLQFINSGTAETYDSGLENKKYYNLKITNEGVESDYQLYCEQATDEKTNVQICKFYNKTDQTQVKFYLGYQTIKITINKQDNPKFLSQN